MAVADDSSHMVADSALLGIDHTGSVDGAQADNHSVNPYPGWVGSKCIAHWNKPLLSNMARHLLTHQKKYSLRRD